MVRALQALWSNLKRINNSVAARPRRIDEAGARPSTSSEE
jgi:hypothetical protein